MSRNRREFSVGEVVHVIEYGRGVVREVIGYEGMGTDYVRIVFEGDKDNYACWLFTADRVLKEDADGRLYG